MAAQDICFKPAYELADMIQRQEITAGEVLDIFIERIERINPIINAFCTPSFDVAREQAAEVDRKVSAGDNPGILGGVPTSVKDLLVTAGIRTTFGGKLWENNVPEVDEVAIQRLKIAGAVILGKTNTSEQGHVPVTDNLLFGHTCNPWNLERTTGGSSGGAAAACACGCSPLNIGTDMGGSIRNPAALCGVFGFKPTYGRVPMYPSSGMSGRMINHYGPITRFVSDAALMLDAVKGTHPGDQHSLPDDGKQYFAELEGGERPPKLRIGVSTNLGIVKAVEPEIIDVVTRAAHRFEEVDWTVDDVKLKVKNPEDAFLYIYTSAFAHDYKKSLKAQRDLISPTLLTMIDAGLEVSGQTLQESLYRCVAVYEDFHQFFQNYDLLITPTVAVTAFKHGTWSPREIDGKGVSPQTWFAFCYVFNITGLPAASLPCGFSSEDLPIGMQVIGPRCEELRVLQASKVFEEIAPWQDKLPPAEL